MAQKEAIDHASWREALLVLSTLLRLAGSIILTVLIGSWGLAGGPGDNFVFAVAVTGMFGAPYLFLLWLLLLMPAEAILRHHRLGMATVLVSPMAAYVASRTVAALAPSPGNAEAVQPQLTQFCVAFGVIWGFSYLFAQGAALLTRTAVGAEVR